MKVVDILEGMPNEEVMHSVAIDYVDDMLAQLNDEEQYGEKGDVLRYIIAKLQNSNVAEAIEGELLTKDRSTFAGIARDLIQGAAQQLYKDGQRPSPEAIKSAAEKGANNFHSMILKAMDNELQKM